MIPPAPLSAPRPAGQLGQDMIRDLQVQGRASVGKFLRASAKKHGVSLGQAKTALKHLVEKGDLEFCYRFGVSFIEASFAGPVRVGKRLILCPQGRDPMAGPDDKVVLLSRGSSFGSGRHPTTRLALAVMESAMDRALEGNTPVDRVMDVGSGSGVLGLAALRLGAGQCLGLDTDPAAVFETNLNGLHNGFKGQLSSSGKGVEQITGQYGMVLANLRWPTLKRLMPCFRQRLLPLGLLVVSGIQADELPGLIQCASQEGFRTMETREERGWAAVGFELD